MLASFASTPRRQLVLLSATVLLAMSLWFSASAVVKELGIRWNLESGEKAWLTMSVQMGFVIGAFLSAALNLADRASPHRLLAVNALLGAFFNACIALGISDEAAQRADGFAAVVVLRVLTGVTLAGVYPPGMKIMASWFQQGRGLAIGILVGALTIGSAAPHLLGAIPQEQWLKAGLGLASWRAVLLSASASALLAAVVALPFVRPGPLLPAAARLCFQRHPRPLFFQPPRPPLITAFEPWHAPTDTKATSSPCPASPAAFAAGR